MFYIWAIGCNKNEKTGDRHGHRIDLIHRSRCPGEQLADAAAQRLGLRGIGGTELLDPFHRGCLGFFQTLQIEAEIGYPETGQTRLPLAEESTGASHFRSSSAILKPSVVLQKAFSRCKVSGLRLWEVRMQ